MSENLQKPLPVALVYGESESSQVLRHALGEIGADLVCDADIGSFSMESLGASGANVVLISLDSVIEDRLDEVYGALDEERYRVMFDDPDISGKLDGWEHARWQRHLAAKLRDVSDWDPPRPEDAVPVEVHVTADAATQAEAASPEWMDDALSVLNDSDTADNDSGAREDPLPSAEQTLPEPDAVLDDGVTATPEPTAGTGLIDDAASSADAPADMARDNLPVDVPQQLTYADEDDAALQAELDALANADDPLAALAALSAQAGDRAPPVQDPTAAAPVDDRSGISADDDADDAHDFGDTAELTLDMGEMDAEPENDLPEPSVSESTSRDKEAASDEDGSAHWDSLEAELSAAFDSDTLGAIDQATDLPGEYSVEVPSWELQAEDATPASDDAEVEPDGVSGIPPGDAGQAPADTAATALDEPENADRQASSADADEPAGEHALPDVSSWALVDDDNPPTEKIENPAPSAALADEPSDVVEASAQKSVPDDDDDDGGFQLELVDPIDYLKPDAPKDVSNELFNMPELMSMAEAVAPKVGDDDESAPDDSGDRIKRLVILGASIGGPDAVREFLSHLPQRLPASLVLVQHLGAEFVDLMVSQLSKSSALPVRIPGRAERAVHGEVLVVPSGCQLKLEPDGQLEILNLDGDAANNPSINLTMTMAAETFGAAATAIIFSGMASDAAAGALEIASRGGEVWVQDPESCVVSNMVDEVVAAGVARFTGTPEALAHKLVAFLQETDND